VNPEKKIKYKKLKPGMKYSVLEIFCVKTGIKPLCIKTRTSKALKMDFSYLDTDGILTIYQGFPWDGATGAIDTEDFMRGSCVHDFFCNAIDERLLSVDFREPADHLLFKLLVEDGMPLARAELVLTTVLAVGKIKHKYFVF